MLLIIINIDDFEPLQKWFWCSFRNF